MRFSKFWICLLISCSLMVIRAAPNENQERVILVSIDGLAAYHLENEELFLPNIRELASSGVWAESSQTVFPSVTHPSHTTMLTGVSPRKHGVINNRMRNRLTGESFHVTNKPRKESVRTETLFDAAKRKDMTTAAFFWPETLDDPSIDFNIAEVFDETGTADIEATNPAFVRELEEAGVPIRLYFEWYDSELLRGAGDIILSEAAAYVIERYQPQLLAIHILATDVLQHNYGPEHYLAQTALTVADRCVGILRQAVEKAGLTDTTTFVITADHGFHTARYDLNLYPLFQESGLLDRVNLHARGWTLWVELQEAFQGERDLERLHHVLEKAKQVEGVARIIGPEEFHELGLPRYEEDPHIPGQYMIVGEIDTLLTADPTSSQPMRTLKQEPYHSHGYLPDHPRMFPALVLSGYRVQKNRRIGHVTHYTLAPTIAEILGLEMKGFEGSVLREALVDAEP